MRILMLGWELPPHNSGGLGVACYQMSKALAVEGATIDFVVPYSADHSDIDFMNIHAATSLLPLHSNGMGAYESDCRKCVDPDECDHKTLKSMRDIQRRYTQFVERLVKKHKPDVIHAHDWLTMEAGIRAKQVADVPLIVHVHATEFDRSGEHYGNPLVHEIEEMGLLMADRIIAVSNITKNIIVREYNIPPEKIEVVYNGLDLSSFDGHTYDEKTYAYLEAMRRDGYTVVTTIGRLTVQKGLGYFMRAAARASEKYDRLLFLIVGNGEQRDELIKLSADLGISDKVFFTGFIRGKRWRDAYSVGDIFVMSSVSEPFGLTALEAAHHDSALVITKQSGVGEVLHSIMRYDYWDTDRLADELVGIATSHALAYELRVNVQNEYTRISWADVAKNCFYLYRKTVKMKGIPV